MYQRIVVPIDLAHIDNLTRALQTAADLARHFGATVTFVSVTAETPTAIAHNPAEFEAALAAFAKEQGAVHGITAEAKAYASTDPAIDTDKVLLRAVGEVGADLVIMASHVPGVVDYLWAGHGAKIAAHSDVSVFLVR